MGSQAYCVSDLAVIQLVFVPVWPTSPKSRNVVITVTSLEIELSHLDLDSDFLLDSFYQLFS